MAQLTIQQTFDLALQHHRAGRLPQAEHIYRQILAQQPNHADSLHLLGVLANQAGQPNAAVELIRRAISIRPANAIYHSNLGIALQGMRQFSEAIASYRHAIELKSDLAEAHNNLGNALRQIGQLDEAIASYRQAIALKPDYAEAHNNLGMVLKDVGRLDEAIALYRQAIALNPNYANACYNLSVALQEKGQLDEAIAVCRQAIRLKPDLAEAHNCLGIALQEKGQVDEAIASFRDAILRKPDFVDAYNNLGNTLKGAGQLDAAIASYRQAIRLKPDYADAHSNLIVAMYHHPACDAQSIAEEHRRWNSQHAQPLQKFIHSHPNDPRPDRRLRLGYVSPDFRDHVVGRNLLPLFQQHDHQQFEITCYAHVVSPDAVTTQFQQHADCWRNIVGLSDEQLAEQIRQDRIDILVDLTLHTGGNRLLVFARKPAPVQVTFAGYPGSTGLTTIDYRLSDPYLDPPGMDESIYSERTIRLPDSFWCYDPLDCRDIPVNSVPALDTGLVTFGCLNNFCKINDGVLALWAQVLRQVEGSRLLLLAPQGSHRQRAVDQLCKEGIAPERIEFVSLQSRQRYLELYHRIDISLDSFPYNGHTTSLDSLWMGVPVVTLVGQTAVSRAGWCQLSNVRLTELAGKSEDGFVRIAVELARDLPRLQELRSTLRRRMEQSPLMDAQKFARNIESAYRQMWHTWCQTALPKS